MQNLIMENLIMGLNDVTGAKCLDKKGRNSNNSPKRFKLWSVKYTEFDNLYKNHFQWQTLCLDTILYQAIFSKVFREFCPALLVLGHIFICIVFSSFVCKLYPF